MGGEEKTGGSPGIGDLAGHVTDDVRAIAQAELKYLKAVAAWRLKGVRAGLPLAVAAMALAPAVATVLLVGLVMTLAPYIGAGWATTIVVLVGGGTVGVLGWAGIRRMRTLFAKLPPEARR